MVTGNLKADGLRDSTIVVYFSDHGANNLVRHKQMATEAGLHVPFIVNGPEKYVPSGQVRKDLVSILDLTATTAATPPSRPTCCTCWPTSTARCGSANRP